VKIDFIEEDINVSSENSIVTAEKKSEESILLPHRDELNIKEFKAGVES
jgi:hypothetical protein